MSSSALRLRGPSPGPAFGCPSELQGPAKADPNPDPDPTPRIDLMSLPTELHLAISKYLIYPDALSLKHTNRHFYSFVCTGLTLKVDWLLERRKLHLDCPNDKSCDFGSDLRFCRGSVP